MPKKNPQTAMKATEDFFLVVLHAYILEAAHTVLQNTMNLYTIASLANDIIERFVTIDITATRNPSGDGIYEYT